MHNQESFWAVCPPWTKEGIVIQDAKIAEWLATQEGWSVTQFMMDRGMTIAPVRECEEEPDWPEMYQDRPEYLTMDELPVPELIEDLRKLISPGPLESSPSVELSVIFVAGRFVLFLKSGINSRAIHLTTPKDPVAVELLYLAANS